MYALVPTNVFATLLMSCPLTPGVSKSIQNKLDYEIDLMQHCLLSRII